MEIKYSHNLKKKNISIETSINERCDNNKILFESIISKIRMTNEKNSWGENKKIILKCFTMTIN